MRRNEFLKTLGALAVGATSPPWAHAATTLKMLIPANPAGGWDMTGRALGKALLEAKAFDAVHYDNKGGAAGALGLTQFVNTSRNDAHSVMVMGAVMLSGMA